jgi:hypothetical protein
MLNRSASMDVMTRAISTMRRGALVKTPSAVSHPFHTTSASWLNMVERFFRDLTANRLRRGVFREVIELVTAIEDLGQSAAGFPHSFKNC